MRVYVITTGATFGLIVLAHILRLGQEPTLASDPWYLLLTVASLALSAWSWRVYRSLPRP
jgi:hypothetical protein